MSSFQGVGIERFHCIQRCPHFRGLEQRGSTVYSCVHLSGFHYNNRGQEVGVPLYRGQEVGIEGCIKIIIAMHRRLHLKAKGMHGTGSGSQEVISSNR